jgi:hypothetical protein
MIDPNELRELAEDDRILTEIHARLEDELLELRDDQIDLVVNERNGTPSSQIRIGTRDAVRIALGTLADLIQEHPVGQRFHIYSSSILLACGKCDENVVQRVGDIPFAILTEAAKDHVCDPAKQAAHQEWLNQHGVNRKKH